MATRSILELSPLRDEVQIVEVVDFQPEVRAWLVHRPPAGRLAGPLALLGETLADGLRRSLGPAAAATG
jgi:hypothetical protein